MTRKDEWLKKYLTADKETRIEMSTKMKKSAG